MLRNKTVFALQSISDRMVQQTRQWESAADQRAIFLTCYKQMTENMLVSLHKSVFHDAVWVGELLRHFADYYFVALDAYDAGNPATPTVWRQAHDMANLVESHVLQNLFLGVNAHINYDLVLTVVDLLNVEWAQMTPHQRERRYQDYCAVNDIIAQTIDAVQDDVVERWSPAMNAVDKMMGRLDEWLVIRLIINWRQDVWQQAVRIMEAPQDREFIRAQVERTTQRRAEAVMLKDGWKSLSHFLHEI